jgi:hypothetical protein
MLDDEEHRAQHRFIPGDFLKEVYPYLADTRVYETGTHEATDRGVAPVRHLHPMPPPLRGHLRSMSSSWDAGPADVSYMVSLTLSQYEP